MNTWMRSAVLVLIGLTVGIGSFVLGRATAPAPSPQAPTDAGFSEGFQAGRAVGVQEGRALQAGQALTGADRDATTAQFNSGYLAGVNDVFGGYDGGWSVAEPYVVTLVAGTGGVTYRIATRTAMVAGVSYYLCPDGSGICQEPR
jgi:hypothetical protein